MKLSGRIKHGQGGLVKTMAEEAKRPPKLKGRVANDLWPNPARSAAGPPPTSDTKPTKKKPRGKYA